jgi:DNA-binding transcriptional ArsR family regulator
MRNAYSYGFSSLISSIAGGHHGRSILHSLSDPVRVAIFPDIVAQECSQNCSTFPSVGDKAIPKSTLSQHFRALREAGQTRGERRGVEMYNTSRCAEIEKRFPGLLRAIIAPFTQKDTIYSVWYFWDTTSASLDIEFQLPVSLEILTQRPSLR